MTDAAAAVGTPPAVAPAARGRRWLIFTVALLVVLPYLPGLDTDYGRSLLTQMTIAAVFALSFNPVSYTHLTLPTTERV